MLARGGDKMKRLFFVIAFVICVLGLLTQSVAQTFVASATTPDASVTASASPVIPEPEGANGTVMGFSGRELIGLEQTKVPHDYSEFGVKAFGLAGAKGSSGLEVPGISCNAEVPKDVEFVVKALGVRDSRVLSRDIKVYPLVIDEKSGKRKIPMSNTSGSWSGKGKSESQDPSLQLTFTQYAQNSWKFTSFPPLSPNQQYLMTVGRGEEEKAYCFQVK